MTKRTRRTHSAADKAKMALAAVRGDQGVMVANLLSNDSRMSLHLQRIRTSYQGQKFRTIAWLEGNTIVFGIKLPLTINSNRVSTILQ